MKKKSVNEILINDRKITDKNNIANNFDKFCVDIDTNLA